MSELVERLCSGDHRVEVMARPAKSLASFRAALDRGYVHLTFTETRGGTDLGIRLDSQLTDLRGADFENGTGIVSIAGNLILDYVRVRCLADIALPDLTGTGRLERATTAD